MTDLLKTHPPPFPADTDSPELPPSSCRAIVNAIPDLIICIDKKGVFRAFSGAVEELYWPAQTYI